MTVDRQSNLVVGRSAECGSGCRSSLILKITIKIGLTENPVSRYVAREVFQDTVISRIHHEHVAAGIDRNGRRETEARPSRRGVIEREFASRAALAENPNCVEVGILARQARERIAVHQQPIIAAVHHVDIFAAVDRDTLRTA